LAAVSSHPKRTRSFRPLMSRTNCSCSVDMGVTSRVSTKSQTAVWPRPSPGWEAWQTDRRLAQPFAARLLDNPIEPMAVPRCEMWTPHCK
jgi:hypothetical protein